MISHITVILRKLMIFIKNYFMRDITYFMIIIIIIFIIIIVIIIAVAADDDIIALVV